MEKFILARRLFDLDDNSSRASDISVIYISSSEDELSDGWELDCSTDTEELVARIEREVCASPMLIGGRIMTVEGEQEDMTPGPSTSNLCGEVTPACKLGQKYFDQEICYAPPGQNGKSRIEICRTLLPVLDLPISPPQHERGPTLNTPLVQPTVSGFHASYHVQNTRPYQKISEVRYTGCMVCGRSVDAIKKEKVEWYMRRYTPQSEPDYVTRLSGEAYENGLTAGCFLFITPECRRLSPVTYDSDYIRRRSGLCARYPTNLLKLSPVRNLDKLACFLLLQHCNIYVLRNVCY